MSGEAIRKAVQNLLDSYGDGYQLGQIVVAMGLERVTAAGVEAIPWVWSPPDQPAWQTRALLEEALEMRAAADIDD